VAYRRQKAKVKQTNTFPGRGEKRGGEGSGGNQTGGKKVGTPLQGRPTGPNMRIKDKGICTKPLRETRGDKQGNRGKRSTKKRGD